MSRYNYYTPDYGTYLADGSFCNNHLHCASECCAATVDDESMFVYEEDLESAESGLDAYNDEMEDLEALCME